MSVLSNSNKINTGYMHQGYAAALSEFGKPLFLPRCRGWVLQRNIPGCTASDAMGCYPMFACEDWTSLKSDLEMMGNKWVTLALVADPFGDYTTDYLRACFPDVMIQFKHHFVVDLSKPLKSFAAGTHLRNARRASKVVSVELCQNPVDMVEDWIKLYDVLIQRHEIHGIAAFSRQSFLQQLQVPGLLAFRAIAENATVGALLWYVQTNTAYYHLGAYSDLGYELRASFALFAFAVDYFAEMGLDWLNLGAGAGTQNNGTDGLTRFKKGWATGSRPAYFCGRIFDKDRYQAIIARRPVKSDLSYFPLYRHGEF